MEAQTSQMEEDEESVFWGTTGLNGGLVPTEDVPVHMSW